MADNKFELKVDTENRCIDRSTPEGQMLDELQKKADKTGGAMGQFMSNVLAYTEVSTVVGETMDKKDADEVMGQLKEEFDRTVSEAGSSR